MITIDNAIRHFEEVAEANENTCIAEMDVNLDKYLCAKEHRQLAEWLKELKFHREAWVKVRESIESLKVINYDEESDYIRGVDDALVIVENAMKGYRDLE